MGRLITHKVIARFLRREAERRHAIIVPCAPAEIYIDPSNACDLRCTFCPQSNWGKRRRGLMPFELYARAIDQAAELKPRRVNLFCYGEALLHKEIGRMIRHAVERGLWVRIHTNAKSLDSNKARMLLESGLSEIRFSFDTADRELYNRLRVRSDFDIVLSNILSFIDLKKELGYSHPLIHLQEMVPFEEGKEPQNTTEYQKLFADKDVIFDARYMHNFAGSSAESQFVGLRVQGKSVCRELYRRLVVTFDGKIHACCLDAEGHNIIGDLAKGDSIESAWNSPAMQKLRHLTGTGQVQNLLPCKDCDQLQRTRRAMPLGRKILGSIAWTTVRFFSGRTS